MRGTALNPAATAPNPGQRSEGRPVKHPASLRGLNCRALEAKAPPSHKAFCAVTQQRSLSTHTVNELLTLAQPDAVLTLIYCLLPHSDGGTATQADTTAAHRRLLGDSPRGG